MSLQSVDRPVSLGHRPMSLLLQALKQIETKAPPAPPVAAMADTSPAPVTSEQVTPAREIQTPTITLHGEHREASAYGGRYEMIRVYDASEIASELAVAGPAHLASVPIVQAPIEAASDKKPRSKRRRRLADEIVALLPDEKRSVISLTSMDGGDLWPLANELCGELAGDKRRQVLAIACKPGSFQRRRSAGKTEPLSLHDDWHALLTAAGGGRFRVLDRRQLEAARDVSCRALLDLWGRMLDEFAYIVIDAASGGSLLKTPLVATSDATFLIVRLGDTGRRQVEQELSRIRAIGGRPSGCLVV